MIDSDLGSATSTSGAMFPLHLGQPIVIDGKTLVPAGTSGVGEVIWAKKAGGSGSPGELVLAARYLDFGGRRLRLRSMNFQSVGDSRYKTVNSIMIASAAAVPGVALVGFAIKGKETTFAAGTLAHAKTAEAFAPDATPPVAAVLQSVSQVEKNADAHP
ncbi:MAG: hypothetical protein B7Z39_02530 [Novosphingobium sp. 12-64-8]|nr:MAG: hypothetical protein B7Z39_02530 [Novosphingobium sp. 12-64-8]